MNRPLIIYDQVVAITSDYLGPAATRFIDRQITNHIGIQPAALTKNDLAQLIDWSAIAMAVITDDTNIIEEYVERLRKIHN